MTSEIPDSWSGTRNAAPPTAISGTGLASTFILSTASSTISDMRLMAASCTDDSRDSTAVVSPSLIKPAADATSVAVNVSPPNTSASVVIRCPTLTGPMEEPPACTTEPPPSPTESRSGIRKSVRTPPISTTLLASRGKPACSTPTSVVVPPTSITTPSLSPVKKAAPRILFVGPDAKL